MLVVLLGVFVVLWGVFEVEEVVVLYPLLFGVIEEEGVILLLLK